MKEIIYNDKSTISRQRFCDSDIITGVNFCMPAINAKVAKFAAVRLKLSNAPFVKTQRIRCDNLNVL